jgi:hypothetical protein
MEKQAARLEELTASDAHESSILAEALGLASIFLPRNRLALLEPYSITLACSPHSFSVVPPFSTPLDATRLNSRGGRTPRRPSTRLVLDSPTRVHHCEAGWAGVLRVVYPTPVRREDPSSASFQCILQEHHRYSLDSLTRLPLSLTGCIGAIYPRPTIAELCV